MTPKGSDLQLLANLERTPDRYNLLDFGSVGKFVQARKGEPLYTDSV
jgi:hypothetical protein